MSQQTTVKSKTKVSFCKKCHTGYKTDLAKPNIEKCPACSPNDFGFKKEAGAPRYKLSFARKGYGASK